MEKLWSRIKEIRARVADRFNSMPKEFREIGAESCNMDALRELICMQEEMNELFDKRKDILVKLIKDSDNRLKSPTA